MTHNKNSKYIFRVHGNVKAGEAPVAAAHVINYVIVEISVLFANYSVLRDKIRIIGSQVQVVGYALDIISSWGNIRLMLTNYDLIKLIVFPNGQGRVHSN